MSSVNSKTSSGQDDSVRKAREDYRKKEADLVKKHAQAVRKLNETYANEVSRLQKNHSEYVGNMRDRSQEALTQRDVKYQKEIEDLRKMHHKQLEKLMQDNQAKMDAQNRASSMEVKQANLGKSDRTNELHDRYSRQSSEMNEKFSNALEEYRDQQRKTLAEREEALREQHEKQLDLTRDERNETVSKLRNEFRQLKNSSSERLRSQEVRHHQDRMRMNENFMDTLTNERIAHNDIHENAREGFQESVKTLKQKYTNAQLEDQERQSQMQNEYKADVEDRIDTQVNRLKREVGRSKDRVARAEHEARLKAKREIENVREAYQKNIDHLESNRKELLDQHNEINAKDIRKIHAEADKRMMENSRYYLDRMSVENFKNRQAYDSMEHDYRLREQFQKENADKRVENVREKSFQTEAKLRENFDANVDVLKAGYEDEKREIRLAANKEKVETVQTLKEHVQKQELDHARRSADLVAKYEKRIQDMNEQMIRERRLRGNREKQLVRDLRRQNDAEKEALKIQYEERWRSTTAAHEKEMRDTSRRQTQKLDEVMRTVKKT